MDKTFQQKIDDKLTELDVENEKLRVMVADPEYLNDAYGQEYRSQLDVVDRVRKEIFHIKRASLL